MHGAQSEPEYVIVKLAEADVEVPMVEDRAYRSSKDRGEAAQVHEHVLKILKRLAAMRTESAVIKVTQPFRGCMSCVEKCVGRAFAANPYGALELRPSLRS
jgi:hypothetical protein